MAEREKGTVQIEKAGTCGETIISYLLHRPIVEGAIVFATEEPLSVSSGVSRLEVFKEGRGEWGVR